MASPVPMRCALVLLVALLSGCVTTSTPPAGPPDGHGSVQIEYEPVKSKLRPMFKALRKSGRLERAADQVEQVAGLPADVRVVVGSCTDGTQYSVDDNTVDFCLQDFIEVGKVMKEDGERDVMGTVLADAEATILHELAHAVIDVRELPITGREEDAADQFMVWQAVDGLDDADLVLSQAYEYQLGDALYEQSDDDEHATDGQRAVNLLCWLYGSDPEGWDHLVDDEPLTEYRADQCEDEWNLFVHAWTSLLGTSPAKE